jgi:hypothetical protein
MFIKHMVLYEKFISMGNIVWYIILKLQMILA